MDRLQKVIRKLRRREVQGFPLTLKSVIINLYRSDHTIKEMQDITLILLGKWYERKQITRVIREYTNKSTKELT